MILPSIPADLAAAATVRMIRAAIGAAHRDAGADDPTAHDGVRRVLQGLTRQAVGRGRGQAQGLTADDCAAILATASIPRRTGRLFHPSGVTGTVVMLSIRRAPTRTDRRVSCSLGPPCGGTG